MCLAKSNQNDSRNYTTINRAARIILNISNDVNHSKAMQTLESETKKAISV